MLAVSGTCSLGAAVVHPALQLAGRGRADRLLDWRHPVTQRAGCAERHARPAPQVEAIGVADNLAVCEVEAGIDAIDDLAASLGEGVGGDPAGGAAGVVG